MNVKELERLAAGATLAIFCCSMTACTSLQSQMNAYDGEVRSNIDDGRWNAAERVVDNAKFECEPHEEKDVALWRSREKLQIKSAFAKSLLETVEEANKHYSKGDLAKGDEVRQSLRDRYFGGRGIQESILEQWLSGGKGVDTGIPESLTPCLKLAWINMLSDRNLARMSMAFVGFTGRIAEIDINGRKESIKKLDAIAAGLKKVDKWKDKIDLFMELLADPDTSRWAPVDRSTYAMSIKKMEAIRNKIVTDYRVKRWNTRVIDRKKDYEEIAQLTAAKNYNAAMQILSSHDWIIKPIGLEGILDFDDLSERAKVASEGLGEAIVRQIFGTGLQGVQYHRKDPRRSILSMFIVGRTYVEDTKNRRKLREAGRVAQMMARAEFVRYLNTAIEAMAESRMTLNDDESHESFYAITKERAQAEVSNLTVLATGVDYEKNEVVFILGWRNPDMGMITPIPMRRVEGEKNLTVSPSVGAYL